MQRASLSRFQWPLIALIGLLQTEPAFAVLKCPWEYGLLTNMKARHADKTAIKDHKQIFQEALDSKNPDEIMARVDGLESAAKEAQRDVESIQRSLAYAKQENRTTEASRIETRLADAKQAEKEIGALARLARVRALEEGPAYFRQVNSHLNDMDKALETGDAMKASENYAAIQQKLATSEYKAREAQRAYESARDAKSWRGEEVKSPGEIAKLRDAAQKAARKARAPGACAASSRNARWNALQKPCARLSRTRTAFPSTASTPRSGAVLTRRESIPAAREVWILLGKTAMPTSRNR